MAMYVRFKTDKELENLAYNIVEKARDKGKLSKGTNEVTKQVERGQAKLVVMAEDVSPEEILAHMPVLCEEKKIPYTYVSNKDELGSAAGLTVGTAAVAVVDPGEKKNNIDEIAKKIDALKKNQ